MHTDLGAGFAEFLSKSVEELLICSGVHRPIKVTELALMEHALQEGLLGQLPDLVQVVLLLRVEEALDEVFTVL